MTSYVILGSGIAGYSAAETLLTLDPAAMVVMVSDDPYGFYSRPGLAYYLTGEIPEKQLFLFSHDGKPKLNLKHVIAQVTAIEPEAHRLRTDSAGTLTYDRLLLATGSSAVPLGIPGETLRGVVKLDNLTDARRFLRQIHGARNAVVVGGGVVAVELVEGLVAQGVKVDYFLRGDWFWSNVLGESEARMIEHHLRHSEVILHHQTEIAEILNKGGKVTGVRTTKGKVIRCDVVGVGIGVRPNKVIAEAAGIKCERGILVDEYLQSSAADVFAAGDVAQIHDPASGRSSIDNLWYPGRKQGRIAALNMTGQKEAYRRSVAVNVLLMAGIMTTIIGAVGTGRDEGPVYTSRGSSESWQQLPNSLTMENGTDVSHMRLIIGEQVLLGALVMGDQKISRPLREMINARVDITPIRTKLLQPDAKLGEHVMEYWIKTKS